MRDDSLRYLPQDATRSKLRFVRHNSGETEKRQPSCPSSLAVGIDLVAQRRVLLAHNRWSARNSIDRLRTPLTVPTNAHDSRPDAREDAARFVQCRRSAASHQNVPSRFGIRSVFVAANYDPHTCRSAAAVDSSARDDDARQDQRAPRSHRLAFSKARLLSRASGPALKALKGLLSMAAPENARGDRAPARPLAGARSSRVRPHGVLFTGPASTEAMAGCSRNRCSAPPAVTPFVPQIGSRTERADRARDNPGSAGSKSEPRIRGAPPIASGDITGATCVRLPKALPMAAAATLTQAETGKPLVC
jgi:hypothetical protein